MVRVGDPDSSAAEGDSRRLVELVRGFAAGDGPHDAAGRVDRLDLPVVGVGDVDRAVVPGHAERVLEPRGAGVAVDVSEREEPRPVEGRGADDRAHPAADHPLRVGQRHRADRAALAVGDEQPFAVGREARWLCEARRSLLVGHLRQELAIDHVLETVARVGTDLGRIERHPPDLMRPRHGDVDRPAVDAEIPRAVERRLRRIADVASVGPVRDELAAFGVEPRARPRTMGLVAGARDGLDGAGGEICPAKQVILRVGDPEHVRRRDRQALWLVEARRFEVAVGAAGPARADHDLYRAAGRGCRVDLHDDDPVVAAVGDEESIGRLVEDHLSRKPKRTLRLEPLGRERRRRLVERALAAVVGDGVLQEPVEHLESQFARFPGDEVALGIDDADARPARHGVGVPDGVVGVVHHRMRDAVTEHRLADVVVELLAVELRGVDPDDDDLVRVGLLELRQLRQEVHAVDAAVGPEIQHDELAAERFDGERLLRVEPAEPGLELGRRLPLRKRMQFGIGRPAGRRHDGGDREAGGGEPRDDGSQVAGSGSHGASS